MTDNHELHWIEENGRGSVAHELPEAGDPCSAPVRCTCLPASSYYPAEPDETCPRHRDYGLDG